MIVRSTLTQYLPIGASIKLFTRVPRTGFLSSIFKTKKHVEIVEVLDIDSQPTYGRVIVTVKSKKDGMTMVYNFPHEMRIEYHMIGVERLT